MSATAVQDLKLLNRPELEKQDGLVNGTVNKTIGSSKNILEKDKDSPLHLTTQSDQPNAVCDASEIASTDIEYTESEKLTDLVDVDSTIESLFGRLDSKDWITVCEALNNVRQIAIYHKERMLEMVGPMISSVVKSLKNPRSAVCKTAIMTSADVFRAYGDIIVDSIDPLLLQLFLKSSQDKRFVCEAAESALIVMTSSICPSALLQKLQPYLKNKNPRIRAKASMCFSRTVSRLDAEGMNAFGIDKLVQISATQLNDQLPESREAARSMALELHAIYHKSQPVLDDSTEQPDAVNTWEAFCLAKLSPLNAQAILRVTTASVPVGC